MVFFRFFSFITLLFIFLLKIGSVYAGEDFADIDDVNTVFESVITYVAIIGGFLSFIALIIGGFKYMAARGDPKAIAGAQGTITWAIIGLALIIIAWLVLVFIKELTGAPVTEFIFKSPFPEPPEP